MPDDGPQTTGPRAFMRLSYKIGALTAAAAFIPILIISLLVLSKVSNHARKQALDQLRSDSRAAASLCEKRVVELRGVLKRSRSISQAARWSAPIARIATARARWLGFRIFFREPRMMLRLIW